MWVAFVLLKIRLFPADFLHVSRLWFHPVVRFEEPLRLNITDQIGFGEEDLVPDPGTNQIREALEFSRFRLKLIEFLKLPFDISEPALREVLERACCGVYENYLARAERAEKTPKSENTLESEDTLEMKVLVPRHMESATFCAEPGPV